LVDGNSILNLAKSNVDLFLILPVSSIALIALYYTYATPWLAILVWFVYVAAMSLFLFIRFPSIFGKTDATRHDRKKGDFAKRTSQDDERVRGPISRDELRVLLAEYQACYQTRDHYDNERWIIGSIFIVTSLSLFGVSFVDPVARSVHAIGLLSIGALTIWLMFVYYDQHTQPWINAAIFRSKVIERRLCSARLEIKLQSWITSQKSDRLVAS
jgi:hypothetical protein